MDLNFNKQNGIQPEELKYQFDFWGFDISEEKFKQIFNKFDYDKDGTISYKDF